MSELLPDLRAKHYGRDYYEEHRTAGLDYAHCGEWQIQYAKWLNESLGGIGARVLDVGCACGGVVRGMVTSGLDAVGVDLCQYMVDLGKLVWPDMASRLFVCDAVNLHLFDNDSFDWLHSAQVAEHWRPDLVPLILRELRRVTRPGGAFFCALDTVDMFERTGRVLENEDPTHICMRTMEWWHNALRSAGWTVIDPDMAMTILDREGSYLRKYDWAWFLAEKPA